jgi:biotin carboxyl carrier protein
LGDTRVSIFSYKKIIIEAIKMESTIKAPMAGRTGEIYLPEKTMVQQDDLVVDIVS